MPRYFLELSFKGTEYSGWQVQINAGSVQQKLDEALTILLRHKINTTGCGRTDTGVHASQFFAHFDSDSMIEDETLFCHQLNSLLPFDISIYSLIPVTADAHARFDATSRTYRYFISMMKIPFMQDYSWYWRTSPDIIKMNEAAELLLSWTDFTSFAKRGGQQLTNDCTIYQAHWLEHHHILEFRITANRFLRGMVRAVVGTLLDVGQHKISVAEFSEIMRKQNRNDAGESVPARGLFLSKITYPYLQNTDRKIFLS
jgi:tRNA pseudouridine38-40 synthase